MQSVFLLSFDLDKMLLYALCLSYHSNREHCSVGIFFIRLGYQPDGLTALLYSKIEIFPMDTEARYQESNLGFATFSLLARHFTN